MVVTLPFLLLGLLSLGAAALPRRSSSCPPFNNGTFTIDQFQLYPENADWDTKSCLVYFGFVPEIPSFISLSLSLYRKVAREAYNKCRALFNASVAVYDPYKNKIVDSITLDGITHNPKLHVGGVAADQFSSLITIVVDAISPFASNGKDTSGDNFIIKYDPAKKSVLWKLNITAVTQGKYGGFQDVATDVRGNTYIVGTFPGTILRVDKNGTAVVPWYLPSTINSTKAGYSGLAVTGDILLVNDDATGEIYRFDTKAEKGTPTLVPRTPHDAFTGGDAIHLPPKYNGTVLLAAEDAKGVTVLRSKDGSWKTAEHLGTVPLNKTLVGDGMVPAAIEIGGSLFMVIEYFSGGSSIVPGTTAGPRSQFPMVDITQEVTTLLDE